MSREIKFRVWIENTLVNNDDYKIDLDGDLYYVDEFNHTNLVIDENYIIEQFTGLTDKNGVEIYEGDVYQFQFMQEIYKGVIVYKENSFLIKLTDLAGEFYEQINTKLIEGHFGTVIGNIHEEV